MKWGVYQCRFKEFCKERYPDKMHSQCERADHIDAETALQTLHERHGCQTALKLVGYRKKLEDAHVTIAFAERGLHDEAEEFFRHEQGEEDNS
jgi:hypothetical protein